MMHFPKPNQLKSLAWRWPLLGLWLLAAASVQGQQATVAAGGDATGAGGSVAYSIGQVDYTTVTGATGSVAQGVQQPYEIYLVGVADPSIDLSLSVFPNPTADRLTLQVTDLADLQLTYELYDSYGHLLQRGNVVADRTELSMEHYAGATYFLHVLQDEKKVQSFKLIKNY